jgi:stage V sporulation protein AE
VVLGVVLYAVGIFDPLFEACGCGITLPLIGFGANVGRGVREAIDQDGISGILSGPVRAMAEGVSAALLSGFILSLIFRGRSKKL